MKKRAQRATVRTIRYLVEELNKRNISIRFGIHDLYETNVGEKNFIDILNKEEKELVLGALKNFRDPVRRLLILREVVEILDCANEEDETGIGLEECLRRSIRYQWRKNWPRHNNDVSSRKSKPPSTDPDDNQPGFHGGEFWDEDYPD